jgi:triosephosphate isomerase
MRKLLAGNWKENPPTEAAALALFKGVAAVPRPRADVVICPPFVYVEEIAAVYRRMRGAARKNLALGVQDVFWEEGGAFTSQIGPKMLRSLGVQYVIIGHSERRRYLKETDAMINKKVLRVLRDRLKVILCVGEPLAIRKKGLAAAKVYIKNQLKKDLAGVKRSDRMIIAYEPIWAIGSGRSDKPEDAAAMADFIKKTARTVSGINHVRVLYGGSVNGKNVRDYVQWKEIDGALVGGASLRVEEFEKIINY